MLADLRAERSAERAKVRREVFEMHSKGLPCWAGKCCQEMRTRSGVKKRLGNDLF
jgi:hypothetical protein